jgi:excisionase family DNA binding protein
MGTDRLKVERFAQSGSNACVLRSIMQTSNNSVHNVEKILVTKDSGKRERRAVQAEVTREWVTYKKAEEISGLSRTTLRKLVDKGQIKIKRVGRAVRINRASLDAYMNDDAPAHE